MTLEPRIARLADAGGLAEQPVRLVGLAHVASFSKRTWRRGSLDLRLALLSARRSPAAIESHVDEMCVGAGDQQKPGRDQHPGEPRFCGLMSCEGAVMAAAFRSRGRRVRAS